MMRLALDITKTSDGRYEGRLTVPGTGSQHDFAGILELLAILEEQLGPEDVPPAGPENSTNPDWVTDEKNSSLRRTAGRIPPARMDGSQGTQAVLD
jgi:hypothetical protein